MNVERFDSLDVWRRARTRSIGASEVAVLMGLSHWKSPYALWAEKTGMVDPSGEETAAQYWGLKLEAVIADEFEKQTGRKLIDHGRYTVMRSTECPILSATLDREIVPIDDRGPGVLEIKTTNAHRLEDWSDGAPLNYQVQIQAQLAVTGFKWGSACVLGGGSDFRWCDVERNDGFIELMTRKCLEFWKLVDSRTPPPLDGSQHTADALKRLHPKDSGESIALSGEAIGWDSVVAECNKVIADAEDRKREATNKIIAAIGDASFGVLPSGGRWSFKNQTRKAFSVEEKTTRVLRRLAK